jgi:hypothetical protein
MLYSQTQRLLTEKTPIQPVETRNFGLFPLSRSSLKISCRAFDAISRIGNLAVVLKPFFAVIVFPPRLARRQ